MEKIKTAIIGMGKMGKLRADVMRRHGGYDIAATCDLSGDCDYQDWRTCIDTATPEAIIICTTNNVMADIVCYASSKGIHVFCEKPPGRNLADTLKMKQAFESDSGNAVLKFGFNHRYHNSVLEAKTLINSGLLGDVVYIRGVYGKAGSETFQTDWRNDPELSGGGILIDQGIHMLDLMLYYMGDLSVQYRAVDRLVWNEMPTEDSASIIMRTADNKVAMLHSSALQWKHKFDMDIMLTDGYIALNGLLTSTQSYGEERITYFRKDLSAQSGKIGNPVEHTMCFDTDNSWDIEMNEFYDAVANGGSIKNGTIGDAVMVMQLVDKIYKGSEK